MSGDGNSCKNFRGIVATILLTTAGLAQPALAQEVAECDWRAAAQMISEPWEDFSRSFANGAVRVAMLDAIEPAAGVLHLLVLSPPLDQLGGRQCRVVSLAGGIGFAGIDFAALEAGYDPARGLTLALAVTIFDGADFVPRWLDVTINQASGSITAVVSR